MASKRLSPLVRMLLGLVPAMAVGLISLGVPFGRDQGVAAYGARVIARGGVIYQDLFYFNLPAHFFVYRLAMILPLDPVPAVNLMGLLLIMATALIIYGAGRRLQPGGDGAIAAMVYAWFMVIFHHRYWEIAQKESLASLPLALSIYALVTLTGEVKDGTAPFGKRALLSAGLCGLGAGFAAQFKPTLGIVILCLLYPAWLGRRNRTWSLSLIMAGAAAFIGSFIPLLVYLIRHDAMTTMIESVFKFGGFYGELGYTAEPGKTLFKAILFLLRLLIGRFFMVGAATVGLIALRRERTARALLIAVLLLLFQAMVQMKFFTYHMTPLLIPLSLLAQAGIVTMAEKLKHAGQSGSSRWRPILLRPGLLWVPIMVLNLAPVSSRYGKELYYSLGRIDRKSFLSTYTHFGGGISQLDSEQLAEYIRSRCPPNRKVLMFGLEPGLYVMSQRDPPTRFAYDLPLSIDHRGDPEFTAYRARLRAQFMREITRDQPEYIIVNEMDRNPTEREDSFTQMNSFPELKRFVESQYHLETKFGYYQVYRQIEWR